MNKVFPTRVEELSPETMGVLKSYRKVPLVIRAAQMDAPFRVKSLEGDYAQGKVGDYLMVGIEGELYICDQEIFLKTYEPEGDE